MRKPNEAAASWLVAKGMMRIPAVSMAPGPAVSSRTSNASATFASALLFAVHAPAANTGGTLPIFASPRSTTPRPFTWSPCSCVTNMAWMRPGSKPASSQRLRKSRLQMPQSISTPAPVAVFSITAAFPELPLANTCNASIPILRDPLSNQNVSHTSSISPRKSAVPVPFAKSQAIETKSPVSANRVGKMVRVCRCGPSAEGSACAH